MTDSDDAGGTLKTDALGRVRSTPAQRAALLEEFERSGLSGTKFAAVAGVNYQTFATWRQQQRKRGGGSRRVTTQRAHGIADGVPSGKVSRTLRWVEAVMESDKPAGTGSAAALMVHLPGGLRVEFSHAAQVPLVVGLCRALA